MSANEYIKNLPSAVIPKYGEYKNFYFPVGGNTPFAQSNQNIIPEQKTSALEMSKYFAPYHNQRPRVDHQFWKEAMFEMEDPILPFRKKTQDINNNTILNGQVFSCMNKRHNLTLLKEYHIVDASGKVNEKATQEIQKKWFRDAMSYILEAKAFGYSLISFGDLVNGDFPKLSIVRRGWISPDREVFSSVPYVPAGIPFNNPNFKDESGRSWYDFSLWVPTRTDIGISQCGYGYLYNVALYEIVLRNIIGWNSDFVEVYGQPLRHAKTNKTAEDDEYAVLERQMKLMGSNAYIITDPSDEIEFIESKGNSGTGWKAYENLEQRDMKFISKIILGHSDAIDATPGKLGAGQPGGDNFSPSQQALNDCEATDSRFLSDVINTDYIAKLQKFGFSINPGDRWELKDDMEKQEVLETEDKNILAAATWAKMMKDAGLEVDADFFTKRTTVPCKKAESPTGLIGPGTGDEKQPANNLDKDVSKRLKNIYGG